MRKALIAPNGFVVNIIELENDAEWTPPDGHEIVNADGGTIGDTWNGSQFVPPPMLPEPVPQVVSRQQIMSALMLAGLITEAEWLACYQSGTLPTIVATAIETLPDATSKLVAKVKWVEFSEARRTDAMVALLAAQAGLTETQIDDLFRTAKTL